MEYASFLFSLATYMPYTCWENTNTQLAALVVFFLSFFQLVVVYWSMIRGGGLHMMSVFTNTLQYATMSQVCPGGLVPRTWVNLYSKMTQKSGIGVRILTCWLLLTSASTGTEREKTRSRLLWDSIPGQKQLQAVPDSVLDDPCWMPYYLRVDIQQKCMVGRWASVVGRHDMCCLRSYRCMYTVWLSSPWVTSDNNKV